METTTCMKTANAKGAFAHAFPRASVIVPTFGVTGDVRPTADGGPSYAWSPPV